MATLRESIEQINRMSERIARQMVPYANLPNAVMNSLIPVISQMDNTLNTVRQTINTVNIMMNNYQDVSMRLGSAISLNLEMFRETIERLPTAADLKLDMPEQIIENINETMEVMEPLIQEAEKESTAKQVISNYNFTVNNYQSNPSKDWIGLLGLLLGLFTLLYGMQQDKIDGIEREKDRIIKQQQYEEFINVTNNVIKYIHPAVCELPVSDRVQDQHTSE